MTRRGLAILLPLLAACGSTEAAPSPKLAQREEPREATPVTTPAVSSAQATPPKTEPRRETSPPKKVSARHILVQYMGADHAAAAVVRTREQARAVAEDVLARAKQGEDFARLAVEFSDEPGAANRGGSLGRFGRGQMVPAFDSVVFKLAVNQISDVVETPFGFHVIQRTD